VPLRSNCRYPFFRIFVHNKSLAKFQCIANIKTHVFWTFISENLTCELHRQGKGCSGGSIMQIRIGRSSVKLRFFFPGAYIVLDPLDIVLHNCECWAENGIVSSNNSFEMVVE